jgi:hypothetical protein
MIRNARLVHRLASLLALACFAALFIGADDCLGYTTSPSATYAVPTCPGAELRYTCVVTIYVIRPDTCGLGPDVTCSANFQYTPCASDVQDAKNTASALARGKAVNGKFLTPQCAILALDSTTPIYNDLVPVDPNSCACSDGTGGGSSGACLSNGDGCSADGDCCTGICSDASLCEACRADGELCGVNSECCSGSCAINSCSTGNAIHHLGLGGSGSGGGSP